MRRMGQAASCDCVNLGYWGAQLYAAAHSIYLIFDHPDAAGYGIPDYVDGHLTFIQHIAGKVSKKHPEFAAAMASVSQMAHNIKGDIEEDYYSLDEEVVLDLFQACQEVSDQMIEQCTTSRE